MALDDLLRSLRGDPTFMANVAAWRTLHSRAAVRAPIPPGLHPALHAVLHRRGITALYSHQAHAIELALSGASVAVVTPTASGKTLCYNLPVLHSLLSEPDARALYLFPTKALAQDQLAELGSLGALLAHDTGAPIPTAAAYDGDTPAAERPRVRRSANLILTNPDMLHVGILPYHTAWAGFFAGLRYVVLDEMHTYRGVFGSHVANVLRRMQRICAFYGSRPQFVCTSATIANPGPLAERLVEQPVTVISENGAPRGEKHIILYNPPVYDAQRGLRRSSVLEAQELAARSVLADVQTIVFGRSRLTTELLLTYLRDRVVRALAGRRDEWQAQPAVSETAAAIRGYRGGYLPAERRAIEAGLRTGDVRAVVATNALELGIDIGQLQAAILCGYPGAIASTWQQMGRAGRTREAALALLVATAGVLDQYIVQNPDFIFERSPEHALINPDNLMLLVDQMRCAAFELPFTAGEPFGASPFAADVLTLLEEQGDLQRAPSGYFWAGEGYPAQRISLRSAGADTVTIQAESEQGGAQSVAVIGEMERYAAPYFLHTGALYLHEGQSYLVDSLDLDNALARTHPANVDFYTEAGHETEVQPLAVHGQRHTPAVHLAHGDVLVTSQVVGYRRIKRFTHETLGIYPLDYPPQEMETTAYWFSVLPAAQAELAAAGQWYDSVNDYGPNWSRQRDRVRARDGYRCTQCGAHEQPGRQHDIHHLIPFRTFGYVAGINENYLLANRLENLVTVCRSCHQRLETAVRVRSGLDGASYALSNLAPLHLMCDPQDLGVTVARGAALRLTTRHAAAEPDAAPAAPADLPTVYIYERAAAGIGFSAQLYDLHDTLVAAARRLIRHCPCPRGCPACVGPVLEDARAQLETKALTLALLDVLAGEPVTPARAGPYPTAQDIEF